MEKEIKIRVKRVEPQATIGHNKGKLGQILSFVKITHAAYNTGLAGLSATENKF